MKFRLRCQTLDTWILGNGKHYLVTGEAGTNGGYEFTAEQVPEVLGRHEYRCRKHSLETIEISAVDITAKEFRDIFLQLKITLPDEMGKNISAPNPNGEDEKCLVCGEAPNWVRKTQFAGDHYYCSQCATKEQDFGKSDPSSFYWYSWPENEKIGI